MEIVVAQLTLSHYCYDGKKKKKGFFKIKAGVRSLNIDVWGRRYGRLFTNSCYAKEMKI